MRPRNALELVPRKETVAVEMQTIKCADGAQELARLTRKFRILAGAGGLLGVIAAVFSALASSQELEWAKGILLVGYAMLFLTSLVWFLTSAFIIFSAIYPAFRCAWAMLANIIAGLLEVFGWICTIARNVQHSRSGIPAAACLVLLTMFAWIIISAALVASALNTSETLRKMQEGQQAQKPDP